MKIESGISFKFTVLLVEDDDNFRTHIAQYLRNDGFDTVEANSSAQACSLVRQGNISLVLLDWDLHRGVREPDDPSTGLEMLRTCHEINPLLPVIVMSGEPYLDVRGDSMTEGADCFLKKPFAFPMLSTLLRRWEIRVKAEKNPFTQLMAGVIHPVDSVNRAYTRAVVEKVGSALRAAPKLGLSRQTVASYLAASSSP